jgi:tRNA 2-thiouridine synthesizing protein B
MLHIIRSQTALRTALAYISSKDDLLLIEDAVFTANPNHSDYGLFKDRDVHVLEEDVKARGLGALISPQVTLVSYSGFVRLTEKHTQSMTWG